MLPPPSSSPRLPLPIDTSLPLMIDSLRKARSMVVTAPPGSGKTTRVAPALLGSGLLSAANPKVILLQPRRVAARSSASRIAEENGWTLGEEVGYQVRFDRRVSRRTRLVVETEGVLNRRIVADPFLEGIGAVILDEFHERSLHTDLAIAFLREVQQTVRGDLILIVMSATLDPAPISAYLDDCPVIHAEGMLHPVEISYRPTPREFLAQGVADAVASSLDRDGGDILVFLDGVESIRRADSALRPLADARRLKVSPLHGSLNADDQDEALRPSADGRRKVVLATNVAETSLTIPGIRTVIDTGLAKMAGYDAVRGLDRLTVARISRASADQRAGRAGRTAPGRCVRLWSEGEQAGLEPAERPEIERLDLSSTLLAVHGWGIGDPGRFGWFGKPPQKPLEAAETLLELLGAIDPGDRKINDLGRALLEIPAHPRLARLLHQGWSEGQPHQAATLAALLSEKDILNGCERGSPRNGQARQRGRSDMLSRLEAFGQAERERFAPGLRDRGIDPIAARQAARVRDDLLRLSRRVFGAGSQGQEADEESILRWILLAYPDRVVKRRGIERTGLMVGGRGVRLAAESEVRDAEFFVAVDPREERRFGSNPVEATVRIASAIEVEWLDAELGSSVRRERTIEFDPERQRPVAVQSVYYVDLLIKQDRSGKVDRDEASKALADWLRRDVEEFFQGDEAVSKWLARFRFLQKALPEQDWPEFDHETLSEVLDEACRGKTSVDEVRRAGLAGLLQGRLTYEQTRRLDEEAPEAIVVPSGSRIKVAYDTGQTPVLAVRLQEVFGWTETPRLARGRVPLLLHLLGPNYRPVQITNDLANFWSSTYFQVRKDLRARYPKHSWPDEPLAAKAENKGGRRRSAD